jgi:cell division protease FtsH
LIYTLLFKQAPLEIRINMATFSGGYNSFNALKVKTRGNLLDAVCVALAGRAAEEMVFGKESLSSGSESDLKLATQQMAAFIRHAAFGERISHVDVSTEAGENINTDVASTNAEIEAGLQTQYERAQTLLAGNRAIYLRMVNELINEGQLAPQKIRDWLGLSQSEVPKDASEPFESKLMEFERRAA